MVPGYHQFAPRPELAGLVDAFWLRERQSADVEALILPDGCIDLVLRADGSDRTLFTSALTTEPHQVASRAGSWFVGVRFKPGRSRGVLGVAPVECRDATIPAASIDASFGALARRLADVTSPQGALRLLEAEVLARAHFRSGPPARVRQALAWLESDPPPQGAVLARRLGMSERSLHRDLVEWTGLAPKVLARILRMQRAARLLRDGQRPLAAVALEAGYADQAHMTRELRRLTGHPPSRLALP